MLFAFLLCRLLNPVSLAEDRRDIVLCGRSLLIDQLRQLPHAALVILDLLAQQHGRLVALADGGQGVDQVDELVGLRGQNGLELAGVEALQHRDDLIDNGGWVEAMIRSAARWNADPRYPGVVFSAYMSSHRSVGCSCGTSYFYLSPYGDVMSCDFNHAIFGNVLEQPLWRVWERLSTDPLFQQAKWGGCKVKDSASLEQPTVQPGRARRVPPLPV
jgi:hypothetical protein